MENRLYKLKNNTQNPSWELRNREVLITKSDKDGIREIQYVPGADSIWKHENEKQGKARSVWFSDGSLSVNPNDKVLIEFLEKHPDFEKEYELYDPEAKAAAEFEEFELIETAKEMLRKYSDDEDKMGATAASLFGHTSMNWGAKETKLRCFKHAESKAKEVISALEDPASEAKYIAALGLRKKIIETNPQQTAVVWNDKDRGVICPVASGKKPLTVLGEFLYDEKNLDTLQEIGKRIDAIDGGKSEKKKPAKKTEKKE